MFDTAPLRQAGMNNRKKMLDDLVRDQFTIAKADPPRQAFAPVVPEVDTPADQILDLFGIWDGPLYELDARIDLAVSWGPFELVEILPAFIGDDGYRRVLCRFAYHGAAGSRGQFEKAFRESISQIAQWEEVTPLVVATYERSAGGLNGK